MREFFILLKKELRSITREKTILLAVIVQLTIASLSTVILEGVMTFYDPDFLNRNTSIVKVGFVGDENTPVQGFLEESKIAVTSFQKLADAETAFHIGLIDAILMMSENQSVPVNMRLFLPKNEARRTAALIVLDEPLKKYEEYLRKTNGVEVIYKDLDAMPFSSYEFLYTVLIPVLMLFPALVAGSMVIDTISEEFENNTLDTLISAPVSARQVYMSKIAAAVVTALIQIILWAGLLKWNGIPIENLPMVLILAASFTVTISLGSALIVVVLKDRQRAQFSYSMILITIGAVSYFLNPSPLEALIKTSSGAPGMSIPGFILYTIMPVPLLLIFNRVSSLVK